MRSGNDAGEEMGKDQRGHAANMYREAFPS